MARSSAGLAFLVLLLFGHAEANAQCDPHRDPTCVGRQPERPLERPAEPSAERPATPAEGQIQLPPPPPVAVDRPASKTTTVRVGSAAGAGARPLQPVRAYLRANDIPPAGVGAYGLIVFQSKPTSASLAKYMMVCGAFIKFFPRSETSSVPLKDQMITVWPLDNPKAKQAKKDDCGYVLDHYDLNASQAAMSDAQQQHAKFEGQGPYLVGWSPSKARKIPDALVLVVDMSKDNTQADIDSKFLFWKNKIVEDPSLWRNGWSAEQVRVAIRNFADEYGAAMLDAIKLWGDKKP